MFLTSGYWKKIRKQMARKVEQKLKIEIDDDAFDRMY